MSSIFNAVSACANVWTRLWSWMQRLEMSSSTLFINGCTLDEYDWDSCDCGWCDEKCSAFHSTFNGTGYCRKNLLSQTISVESTITTVRLRSFVRSHHLTLTDHSQLNWYCNQNRVIKKIQIKITYLFLFFCISVSFSINLWFLLCGPPVVAFHIFSRSLRKAVLFITAADTGRAINFGSYLTHRQEDLNVVTITMRILYLLKFENK